MKNGTIMVPSGGNFSRNGDKKTVWDGWSANRDDKGDIDTNSKDFKKLMGAVMAELREKFKNNDNILKSVDNDT